MVPRYFLHLKDGTDMLLDPDGVDLPADAVKRTALRSARDCMCGDVRDGKLDLRYSIEVQDEDGAVVHRLGFADAVEVVSPR